MRPQGLIPLALAALALHPAGVAARGSPGPQDNRPPQPAADAAATEALQGEFDALVQRFEQAMQAFYERIGPLYKALDREGISQDEAEDTQRQIDEAWAQVPSKTFVAEFEAFAAKAKGTPLAVKSLLKVLEISQGPGSDEVSKRVVGVLVSEHIGSEELAALGFLISDSMLGTERYLEVMNTLREKSPHAKVKASATLGLARNFASSAPDKAKGYYRELIAQWGALEAAWGGTYAEIAGRAIFELEHLQIGMVAPDFESIDETGAKFKVSDYRGKVVVLDFWGYW